VDQVDPVTAYPVSDQGRILARSGAEKDKATLLGVVEQSFGECHVSAVSYHERWHIPFLQGELRLTGRRA
jgi:hypothetical protein